MKYFLKIWGLLLLSTSSLWAQTTLQKELTGSERTALVATITKAHKQLSSYQSAFTQEKTSKLFVNKVVQKGLLTYKAPQQLRWEYTSPKKMTIIFNASKVLLKTDKGIVNNPNKMLNELGQLIINTINGTNLVDNTNFKARYYRQTKTGHTVVDLWPVNKRLKTMYLKISVTLDAKTHLAREVKMIELNNDVTTIYFSNSKINPAISTQIFIK